MLSTAYRLRLEEICKRIATHQEVSLEDIIWAEKLSKANRSAATLLRSARRRAANPNMSEDSLDAFMDALDLGDPDPSNHRSRFESADDIIDFFSRDNESDWRNRD
jgi:hypothetical protein